MFSTTFSTASSPAPRIYATAEEAEAAAANERRQAPASRKKDDYETVQSRQRAEMILGQYDLLIKYAVENGVVSCPLSPGIRWIVVALRRASLVDTADEGLFSEGIVGH
ncbi:hypothetical protein A1O7_10120 [Cladophialophora yegresii CBS 114405]|uniref:Uncharacterized protein n=1 Tax=Cladophialophora yegresii CBS 114405 TaxID=1182544 RepID=W9W8A7_9EURO|nr:uncharacterized protein A1O7_10120 [Cladophialophora yegresii CBS 114405]EXJ54779.1 hypothetical protein A1O7_10120 [Cladophialophora yegresii CBS 114405]